MAPASLLLWLPQGCSGNLSVPAVAMHSAVSGTLSLAGGFLGLGHQAATLWGQLGLGGRGLCLCRWGAGQGHQATTGSLQPEKEGLGGLGAEAQCAPGWLPGWACPRSWLFPAPTDCRQLRAWRGWARGSGSFPQAGHSFGMWGPGPGSRGQSRGLSFHHGSWPGSQTAPPSTS